MNKRKKMLIALICLLLGSGLLIILDQWTKYLAVAHLKGTDGLPLISGVLELQYLENRGAAFGILQNMQWVFYIMTAIFIPALIWLYVKMPKTKKYLPAHILVIVLTAGAFGNLIDRIRVKYVIDFIYFSLIDFPVFNVADIYVTLSVIAVFILVFFVYKDEDYEFLKRKSK